MVGLKPATGRGVIKLTLLSRKFITVPQFQKRAIVGLYASPAQCQKGRSLGPQCRC
jgi:hypothetical protein